MEGDSEYFSRRAAEERRAAMRAVHSDARKVHLEMAERYDQLARGIEMEHARLGLGAGREAIS